MQSVYNDSDYLAVYRQRRKILNVFWWITGAYLAVCLGCLFYHFTLPYQDPLDNVPRAIVYGVSAVYMLIIFPYMAIKFSRVNHYYKLFKHFCEALKMEETYHFYGFRECKLQKDNVDAISCVFAIWNKKKQLWMEREVYWDPEKDLPDFERGDLIRYITQSNFILQYEILEKSAVDLGSVFDYEYYEETDEPDEYADENDEDIDESESTNQVE